jgi:hypothetical protein
MYEMAHRRLATVGLENSGFTAAASALGAYLTTVLPGARRELRRLGPLSAAKAKNAEAVAVFATLAPHPNRAAALRAIVALQVAVDLRDELEETSAAEEDTANRLRLLEESWRREVTALPRHEAIAPLLERAVERCEEGQRRTHAAADGAVEQLREWAAELDAAPGYRWWELAAGASSSAAAHALVAAAADPDTTATQAAAIDAAYHPPVGALTVFLDDLVDRDADRAAGEHNYLDYYVSSAEAAERLAWIADRAGELIGALPHSARHRAILAGVGAFYLNAREAQAPYAAPIRERLLDALGPGTTVPAAFMRLRRIRERPGRALRPSGS